MKYDEEMKKLNMAIRQAEKSGLPTVGLYKRQIAILETAHSEFLKRATSQGFDINTNVDVLAIEIKQFSAMKQIAQKAGMPIDIYDSYIREARVRVLGEEVVKEHFDNV